jgi:uncharacterized protein
MNRAFPEIAAGRRDLVVFTGLVLGLSWLQFIPPHLEGNMGVNAPGSVSIALGALFMFSPVVAALVLITWGSVTESPVLFLRQGLRWRVPAIWYIIVLLAFPFLAIIATVVFTLHSEPIPLDETALMLLVLVFTYGFIANLFENYGWRGFLQEGLQAGQSALISSLVVGVIWGLWHAPLVLVDGAPLSAIPFSRYMALLVGLSVLIGWVYNETGGSVLLVALMHSTFNGSIGLVTVSLINSDSNVAGFITITTIIIWLAVGALLVRTNSETLSRIPGTADEM